MLLNQAQKRAVESESKVIAVIAAAGSGKTYVMIERIYHLIKNCVVNPGRLKPITFTRKAAGELKNRLRQLEIEGVRADTFHSFCYALINGYATRLGYKYPVNAYDEHLSTSILVDIMISHQLPHRNPMKNESYRFATPRVINNALDKIYREKPEAWIQIDEEYLHRLKTYNAVDYSRMISETVRLLNTNPDVRAEIHNRWHHFMIDEFQDTDAHQMELIDLINPKNLFVIGDFDQCVDGRTVINTERGDVPIHELNIGDSLSSYRNGKITNQKVTNVSCSNWIRGVLIRTQSGKELLMSPNHKIWATMPVLTGEQHIVYLMYKRTRGYRIGTTNKCKSECGNYDFGQRGRAENADLLWIIDICDDRDEALFKELSYSLEYGIPTLVFNAKARGLNEATYKQIYDKFGRKGYGLLLDKGLDFHYPHWLAEGKNKGATIRYRVNLLAHSESNNQVSLEWTGNQLDSILNAGHHEYHKESMNRRRIRKWFDSHANALEYAETLTLAVGGYLRQRIHTGTYNPLLVTASGLHEGMSVIVNHEGLIKLDEIISVETNVEGTFFDIEVEDSNNFFGNGILSHNSIYGWRGAHPENINTVVEREGCELIHLDTNYRCSVSIIERSNQLIANNPNELRVEASARDEAEKGVCLVRSGNDVWGQAAFLVQDLLQRYRENEIAVLCRDNGREHYPVGCYGVVEALKRLGIRYKRITREGSFWQSYEIRNIIYTMYLILNLNDKAAWALAVNFPFNRLDQVQRLQIRRQATHNRETLVQACMGINYDLTQWVSGIQTINNDWKEGVYSEEGTENAMLLLDAMVDILKWQDHFKPLTGRRFHFIIERIKMQMKGLADNGYPGILSFIEWWLSKETIKESPHKQAVEVSTIHSYKGLEKRVVVIPGVEAGKFPKTKKAGLDIEEECRILYVGITRAEEECYVLFEQSPSQFLIWAGFLDPVEETAEAQEDFI